MKEAPADNTVIIHLLQKIHWHVVFTHFPISMFLTSSGFMFLHVFIVGECFDLAAFLTLAAGTAMMLPATLSGWLTWKRGRYHGMRGKIFLRKAGIAYAMIVLSISLVLWHTLAPNQPHTFWHYAYALSTSLLLVGAIAEGYYGGRLTHK